MCTYIHTIERIISSILDKKVGIFDEAYIPFIRDLLGEVNQIIENANNKFIYKTDSQKILKCIGMNFRNYLIELCSKTLITELYENKDKLLGDSSKERYKYFTEKYINENFDNIFKENSQLVFLIKHRTQLIINSIQEILYRLNTDYLQIKSYFGLDINILTNINMGYGDTHNNGRSVCILEFDNTYKLVYKPHTLKNDLIFNDILEIFNSSDSIKYKNKHLNVLDKDNYGYEEFISYMPCNNIFEAEKYMYRVGCIVFISYLINFSDLHLENIVCHGEYPYIIDTETLFTNNNYLKRFNNTKSTDWIKIIINSVYNSFLIPLKYNVSDTVQGFNGIPIDGIDIAVLNETTEIINRGLDTIRFDKVKYSIKQMMNPQNQLYINDKKIQTIDYIEYIMKGFADCYKFVMSNKDTFVEKINSIIDIENTLFRQCFRNTQLYKNLQLISYHPYYLNSPNGRLKVFSCLKPKSSSSSQYDMFVLNEIKQLMNDDIPILYTKYNSKSIYCPDNTVIDDFFDRTYKEQLIEKVNKLNEYDLNAQSYLIKTTLTKNQNGKNDKNRYAFKSNLKSEINNKSCYNQKIISITQEITKYIYENQFIHLDEELVGFNVTREESGYYVNKLSPNIYDGIGIVLLYLQVYKKTNDKDLLTIIERLISTFNSEYDLNSSIKSLGAYNGLCSCIYLNYYAYTILHDRKYYDFYKQFANYILNCNLDEYNDIDIVGGCSGIILLCLNIYKSNNQEQIMLDIADKFGKKLCQLCTLDNYTKYTGFAHGYSGMSCALMMLSYYTKNDNYYNLAINLLNTENSYFDSNINNWLDLRTQKSSMDAWCYGSGGILISRMCMLDYAHENDKKIIKNNIDVCLERLMSKDYKENDLEFLCHGICGNLDMLLSYYNKYKDERVKEYIDSNTKSFVDILINKGILFDETANVLNISFMIGISGIAYYLLRYIDNNLPSVLFLEI